jgi:hypothetical protein
MNSLNDKNIDLLFCLGPAGTGKTLFACNYAISRLYNNSVKKIIITRPTITIEENMGYLPGDINDKMQPFMNPIYDIFLERFTQKEIESLRNNNVLEVVPLGFIQGRTFKNSIVIADEMQNSTPNQMFMFLTRLGDNSKMKRKREEKRLLGDDVYEDDEPDDDVLDMQNNQTGESVLQPYAEDLFWIQIEDFVDEIAPIGGSSIAKYVTSKINFQDSTNFLKVRFAADVEQSASVTMYYKLQPAGTIADFNTVPYVKATPTKAAIASNDSIFSDVEYEIAVAALEVIVPFEPSHA